MYICCVGPPVNQNMISHGGPGSQPRGPYTVPQQPPVMGPPAPNQLATQLSGMNLSAQPRPHFQNSVSKDALCKLFHDMKVATLRNKIL